MQSAIFHNSSYAFGLIPFINVFDVWFFLLWILLFLLSLPLSISFPVRFYPFSSLFHQIVQKNSLSFFAVCCSCSSSIRPQRVAVWSDLPTVEFVVLSRKTEKNWSCLCVCRVQRHICYSEVNWASFKVCHSECEPFNSVPAVKSPSTPPCRPVMAHSSAADLHRRNENKRLREVELAWMHSYRHHRRIKLDCRVLEVRGDAVI